jgi:hypothetical protein
MHKNFLIWGCIQKFLDWLPEVKTAMVQLSATRYNCIAILWVSFVSFAAITLCVASQQVFLLLLLLLLSISLLSPETFGYTLI